MRIFLLTLILMASPAMGEIVIRGLGDERAKTVRDYLSLTEDCALPGWIVRYRFRNADTEIRQALETWGYYSPQITKSLTFGPDCWRAEYDIDEGPPTRIRQFDFDITGGGRNDSEFHALREEGRLKEGGRFDHQDYGVFKDRFEQAAAERGYFEAGFTTASVTIDRETKTADVYLVFDTGPRYTFGAITFENANLTEALVMRYLPFQEGEPYDAVEISELYQALFASGYFDDVTIHTTIQQTDHTVPLLVRLTPANPDKTKIGLGVSTDIGPKASFTYSNLRLNEAGQRLDANLSLSPVQKEAGVEYRFPAEEHRNGWTSLYGGYRQEDVDTSHSRRSTLGVRQLVPRRNGWFESRFVEVVDDHFEVADESGSTFSVVPGISWSHTSTSAARRPLRGHYMDLELFGTSDTLGSTISYTSVIAHAKLLRPLGFGFRLVSRGRIGAVLTDEFDRLSPSVRLFSGGDDRVRGYDFKSIGPTDEAGEVIGGNRVVEASLEIDHLITRQWAAAVFIDTGNATMDQFASELEMGAGVGVRWYSPLGPLRLDIAAPVHSEKSGVRLHLSFGPDI